MSVNVDTSGFSAMCKAISRMADKPFPLVVQHQVAAILSTAIKYTPSVQLGRATRAAQNKVTKKFNTYAGGRAGGKDQYVGGVVFESAKDSNPRISRSNGRLWWKDGPRFYHMGGEGEPRRWSDARWRAYETEEADRKADLAAALTEVAANVRQSRGLGKHSWLQCAEELGIDSMLRGVAAYVKKARAANGRVYQNGTGREDTSAGRYFIEIVNTSPIMESRNQGVAILNRAIQSRLSAFETETTKGVFNDAKVRAERYPGIFLTP